MKDPDFLIEHIYGESEIFVARNFKNPEDLRIQSFDYLLNDYQGFDIVEVICREAAYFLIYENLARIFKKKKMVARNYYFDELNRVAYKYSISDSWPGAEVKRAHLFMKYVQSAYIN